MKLEKELYEKTEECEIKTQKLMLKEKVIILYVFLIHYLNLF